MKIRMLVSSTAARAGAIIARDNQEAKRLIKAGYAEAYKEDNLEERVKELEERMLKLENRMKPPAENTSKSKSESAKEPAKGGK